MSRHVVKTRVCRRKRQQQRTGKLLLAHVRHRIRRFFMCDASSRSEITDMRGCDHTCLLTKQEKRPFRDGMCGSVVLLSLTMCRLAVWRYRGQTTNSSWLVRFITRWTHAYGSDKFRHFQTVWFQCRILKVKEKPKRLRHPRFPRGYFLTRFTKPPVNWGWSIWQVGGGGE